MDLHSFLLLDISPSPAGQPEAAGHSPLETALASHGARPAVQASRASFVRQLTGALWCLALPLAAATAEVPEAVPHAPGFDVLLENQLREVQRRAQQSEWENRWAPAARPPLALSVSADSHLNAIVRGLDRVTLDRGSWSNAYMAADHYAAPDRLAATTIGQGVTTTGRQRAVHSLVAAR